MYVCAECAGVAVYTGLLHVSSSTLSGLRAVRWFTVCVNVHSRMWGTSIHFTPVCVEILAGHFSFALLSFDLLLTKKSHVSCRTLMPSGWCCSPTSGLDIDASGLIQFTFASLLSLSCLDLPCLDWFCWRAVRNFYLPKCSVSLLPHIWYCIVVTQACLESIGLFSKRDRCLR